MSDMLAPGAADRRSYDAVTIALHWTVAVIVVFQISSPVLWHFSRAWRRTLEPLHISFGILLAIVLVARLVWRMTAGKRLPPADHGPAHWLSLGSHIGLYVLLVAQVILGFTLRWLQGEDFSFFGLFSIPSFLAKNRGLAEQIQDIHNVVGWTIIVIAGVHALAALAHHYVFKDNVLQRMIPAAGTKT